MFHQVLCWFTLSAWLLWFLVYWRGGRRALADIQKSVQGSSRLDTALMLAIAFGSLALAFSGLGITLGRLRSKQTLWLTGAGTVLTLAGIIGTFYCRRILGNMWTAETTLQSNHIIVDSGPYGIIRHPIYSAVILMYIGITITFAAWWTASFAAVVILSYALKAQLEDDFLAGRLPRYREYQRKVRFRLIPGLW